MATVPEALAIAIQHHRSGRFQAAEQIYRQILTVEPDHADALHLTGLIAHQLGKHELAIEFMVRAVHLKGKDSTIHNNLGGAYAALSRMPEAIACFRRAVQLNPNYAQAHSNLGNALRAQGKLDEAVACCRRALAVCPDLAEAHSNLGIALREQGKLDEAAACSRRAISLSPNLAEAHGILGIALRDQGKLDEAVACSRRAVELKPDFTNVHNLGIALCDLGGLDEAVACCRQALELKADSASAYHSLGSALKDQGKLDGAIASFRRAIELKPDFVDAHSSLLHTLLFCPGYDGQAILEEHRRWSRQHAEPLAQLIPPHGNDRSTDRRLRIGYVSPDFRNHATAFFTSSLLSAHDHHHFEIYCYSDVLSPTDMTERFRSYADVWRNIVGLTDEQLAEIVRRDQIDILVDLTMHMARNRLLAFARKPAPVQLCWAAYPGTTGLSTMDYRLTDPYLDPPGLHDHDYAEESIRLPDSFWCYDPLGMEPQVGALPALENRHVTFGSLNNFCKVNAPVLELWAAVLSAVDGSRLILLSSEGTHRQHTGEVLERAGVERQRVSFVAKLPRPRYLEQYHGIDIALDTFPYNGHTTGLDALWMGVPTVTLVGRRAVGRAGLCFLSHLGLTELAAGTPEQYVGIAMELAGDLPRLRGLRASLRDRLRASPLMDAPRFGRNVEAAYREIWRLWCVSDGGISRAT
jgi:predicted O-linked N-acetylglucosamine transferase (SPINDLY family)